MRGLCLHSDNPDTERPLAVRESSYGDVAKVETTADRTKPRQLEELQNSAGMGGKAEKDSLLRGGKACALL